MAPTNLVAAGVSESQTGLTWQDNSSDETAFRIERTLAGTVNWTEIATVTANATTYNDSGFSCSSPFYSYRVRAFRQDDGVYSGYSNVASGATVPCAPSQITATLTAPAQISLTWQDNSPDESDFHVERSLNGTTGWSEVATVGANTATYNNSGLSCSTAYYYRVRAHRHSDGLFSSYSNVSDAITTPPCSPSNASASAASEFQINLTWHDNSPDESAFLVERSPDGSTGWTQIVTTTANATNYNNVGLSCSTAYYYRLRAYRQSDGQYSASYSNLASAVTAPCAPSNLNTITGTLTQIDMTWQDNSPDESAFHIERSPDGSTGWAQVGTVGANTTSYSNTGLWCDTTYYYRARAYRQSDGQHSGYSNTTSFTTLPCFKIYLPVTLRN